MSVQSASLENSHTLCCAEGELQLYYAREGDRRMIYDLSTQEPAIILSMFDDVSKFRWEDIRDEAAAYFDGSPGPSKYLIIQYKAETIGFFIHVHHPAIIANMELHIWFCSKKHTGNGLGQRCVNLMKAHLHATQQVERFLMRPWTKNPYAIRAYQKCGFDIIDDFDLSLYFTHEEIAKYGNGAYSPEETCNMLACCKPDSM